MMGAAENHSMQVEMTGSDASGCIQTFHRSVHIIVEPVHSSITMASKGGLQISSQSLK